VQRGFTLGWRPGTGRTAPIPDRVEAFKEHDTKMYHMPTWGWNDLYCAGSEQRLQIFIVGVNPQIHSWLYRRTVSLTPTEVERLWGMYTKFRGIPRRWFPAVFHYGEEHELGKIHQAINHVISVKDFGQAASGPIPFRRPQAMSSYESNPLR